MASTYVAALKMRHKSIGYSSLQSSSYRVHMIMGQSGLVRVQEPTAIFELKLDSAQSKAGNSRLGESFGKTSSSSFSPNTIGDTTVSMEFNHEELSAFFEQLERVQSQIDALV